MRDALDLAKLEKDFPKALTKDEFFLVYQPQYALPHQALIGAEALLRWRHPELGIIKPADFIPLAEQNNSIIEIGKWVLNTACSHYQTWQQQGFLPPLFKMAINVSPKQLVGNQFVDLFKQVLSQTQIDASTIELELTETSAGLYEQQLYQVLQQLKALKVTLAMDDFGIGYSCLSRLKYIPFDTLKIDKIFVDGIVEDEYSQKLLQAIIKLGLSLGLTVISEGIETKAQLDMLIKHDCSVVQGFYFEPKHFEFDEMTKFLRNGGVV